MNLEDALALRVLAEHEYTTVGEFFACRAEAAQTMVATCKDQNLMAREAAIAWRDHLNVLLSQLPHNLLVVTDDGERFFVQYQFLNECGEMETEMIESQEEWELDNRWWREFLSRAEKEA